MRNLLIIGVCLVWSVFAYGQSNVHGFQSTEDGSLFCWNNEDPRNPGISVCPKDSLYTASRNTVPDFPLKCNSFFFSGNNKYIFWTYNGKMFRANYHADGLTDTLVLNYPNLSQFACESNYDGTKVLACYDAPSLPKRCSPGFRMLLSFELRNGQFQVTDTLSPPDTCQFVSQANFLANGFVLWRMGTAAHLMQPNGDGTYREVELPVTKYIPRPAFLNAKSSTSIFFYGYVKDAHTMQDDSLIELYEMSFVNGTYTAPLKIREWRNMPQWSLRIAVAPDGTHLSWVDVVKDKNGKDPDVCDVYTSQKQNGIWSEPELVFSEVAPWGQRSVLTWMYANNSGLYWFTGNGRMILCDGFHKGAFVSEVALVSTKSFVQKVTQQIDIVLEDTLIAKEQRLLHFQFVNDTPDTLRVTLGQSTFLVPSQRIIPITSNAYTTLSVDFPDVVTPNPPQNTWVLAPGDTCAFGRRVSFMASGEEFRVSLYVSGGAQPQIIEWSVRTKMVLRDIRRSVFDPFIGANGIVQEQCVRTKNGFQLSTWYPNGKLHTVSQYDEKGHQSGTWHYYNEAGVKIVENVYRGENRRCTTWYDNGKLKSSGKYRKTCKLGIWREYYEGGERKSVAHFRRYWLLDITTRPFSAKVEMCSSALKYKSWYASGRKQSYAHHSLAGRKNRTWTTWYESGVVNARVTYYRCNEDKRTVIYSPDGNLCYDSKVHSYLQYQQCTLARNVLLDWPQLEYRHRKRRSGKFGYNF